jgi:Mg/Co/Ni transporter MgtE
MSPRAAWRLETLGFSDVYDYVAGKADWLAAGLPTEGPGAATLRPGGIARRRVATCLPAASVAEAYHRVRSSEWTRAVVVNDQRVVLGVLDEETLTQARSDETTAEAVMRAGPTTVRAHDDLEPLLHRMHDRHATTLLVTDPDGHLLGVLVRDDADQVLTGQAHEKPLMTGRCPP